MADDDKQLPLNGSNSPTNPEGAKPYQPVNIEDEMRRSYLDYAMSVIVGRALPDVRDGLKPVHRRILYAMHSEGLLSNKKYSKCAGVVGEVLKKYHPHGDAPVYDALVRMAQDFNLRYLLVDGQGNFGSVDGDPPAAYRYTEARLTKIAEEMLQDIAMDTVDMVPNFDESTEEPTVLPTRIPNLLINGSDGIAVGMATKIPPHNLTEILDAALELLRNPKATLAELMAHVQGPDFPTGGILYGKSGIAQAYATGRGSFMMRARAAVEPLGKDRKAIIVTEIPYQVNKARLIERVAELVQEKRIEGISDLRDESDRDGMRIVFELKRGEQPELILNQLYKNTNLQTSFGMILLAVVNGQPRELGLSQAIQLFLDHRVDVVRRRTTFELRKAREREHVLEGYKIALDHLDAVITLIRASSSPKEAREGLVAKFKLSERQAQAILDLQLHRLTGLERQKILAELEEIRLRIAELESILGSDKKLRGVIADELKEIRKDYGGEKDPRRTEIQAEVAEIAIEDLIKEETVAITVTHSGYLKRTPISTYRLQRRGGGGRKGAGTRDEDFVEHLFVSSTHSYILVFTNTGRVYWLKVYEIPDAAAAGKGKAVQSLVALQAGEEVKAMMPIKDLESTNEFIVMVTRQGTIKKTPVKDFSNPMARGIIAMGVEKGDELVKAKLSDGKSEIFLATHEGQSIRFKEKDVRGMGRVATGVRGMKLDEGDFIVGMEVSNNPSQLILSVTEGGYGKRTPLDEYRLQSRGGSGVINVKTTARNGKVVAVMAINETPEVMIISQQGKIIRCGSSSIREVGRASQGVRILRLEEGDQVAAASVLPPEEAEAAPDPELPLQ
ncbi:MAG TPA: DNA gyrase subunit A [Terriglobales bacterium]|nr:DNA gyrase subunit A [Terriglobales bacterium]